MTVVFKKRKLFVSVLRSVFHRKKEKKRERKTDKWRKSERKKDGWKERKKEIENEKTQGKKESLLYQKCHSMTGAGFFNWKKKCVYRIWSGSHLHCTLETGVVLSGRWGTVVYLAEGVILQGFTKPFVSLPLCLKLTRWCRLAHFCSLLRENKINCASGKNKHANQ